MSRVIVSVVFMILMYSTLVAHETNSHAIPNQLTTNYAAAVEDIQSTIDDKMQNRSLSVEFLDESNTSGLTDEELGVLKSSGEAYRLAVSGDAVTVSSFTPAGALFGLSQLQSQLNAGTLRPTTAVESPALSTRVLHFIMRGTSAEEFKEMIVHARRARMNTLIVQTGDAVAFESFPGRIMKDALSVAEFRELVVLAGQNGLAVIPELKFLTHQEKFLQGSHPDLMFNKITYDPNKDAVYELVERHLDEIIDVVKPSIIHIGHDEVKGFGRSAREKWLSPGEEPLPAELFQQDTLKLHQLISARGLRVMMWGDMLLRKEHVHEIFQRSWEPRKRYAAIADKLPRDIIIVDWRYFDQGPKYPSTDAFIKEGFTTFGAAWYDMESTRAFSKYLAERGDDADGMVATTWSTLRKEQYSELYSIISESGKVFWDGG